MISVKVVQAVKIGSVTPGSGNADDRSGSGVG
jgi:hypothetical protein